MGAENRLKTGQLAALAPGDTVTIETGSSVGRPRLSTGTVVRVEAFEVFVSSKGRRGGKFLERYSRRNGQRVSSGQGAELVNAEPAATVERQREAQHIDALWLAWRRNRGDVDRLRELYDAIGARLHASHP